VHDIVDLEGRGVPGVFVASVAFTDAAVAQSHALGCPDVRCAFVAHPIQDRTDAEVAALADAVLDAVVDALTRPARPLMALGVRGVVGAVRSAPVTLGR
jgi:hypothetical protein